MPQREIKRKPVKNLPVRFQMQIPADELEGLKLAVARMRKRRVRGESTLTKDPSDAKVVRIALRQLFGTTTTEQLEDLLETTDL